MMRIWRRNPPGALAQTLSNARHWPMTRGFLNMSEEEFEAALRAEGASDKLVETELAEFRQLKAQVKGHEQTATRRKRRQDKKVPEELDPYVQAEIRRIAGVAADDVLKEIEEE